MLCLAKLKEREQFEDLTVDGSITLKYILNKQNESSWSVFSLEWRLLAGFCGQGNEPYNNNNNNNNNNNVY